VERGELIHTHVLIREHAPHHTHFTNSESEGSVKDRPRMATNHSSESNIRLGLSRHLDLFKITERVLLSSV
jgi:hypothetical protein